MCRSDGCCSQQRIVLDTSIAYSASPHMNGYTLKLYTYIRSKLYNISVCNYYYIPGAWKHLVPPASENVRMQPRIPGVIALATFCRSWSSCTFWCHAGHARRSYAALSRAAPGGQLPAQTGRQVDVSVASRPVVDLDGFLEKQLEDTCTCTPYKNGIGVWRIVNQATRDGQPLAA